MKQLDKTTGQFKNVYVKALDSMPVGTQIEYTGNTIPTGWEEVNDYSTTEMDTGKKWIDGKSIYRKSFSGTITTVSSFNLGTIGGVGTIVNMYGYAISNGYATSLFQYWDSGLKSIVQVEISSGDIYINAGSNFLNCAYSLTIEYTKSS